MTSPTTTIAARGNYYAERDYLKTDVRKGVTRNRAGTRILSLTSDFLRGIRTAFQHECGPAADAVLDKCGRSWGRLFAQRFSQEMEGFYGMPTAEFTVATFEACLSEAFSHHGWGKLKLDTTRHEQGLIVAVIEEPVFAELLGTAELPVDAMTAGVLAGFFSVFSAQELECVQTQCKACGAADSRFVLGLPARLAPVRGWVEQKKTHDAIVNELAEVRV